MKLFLSLFHHGLTASWSQLTINQQHKSQHSLNSASSLDRAFHFTGFKARRSHHTSHSQFCTPQSLYHPWFVTSSATSTTHGSDSNRSNSNIFSPSQGRDSAGEISLLRGSNPTNHTASLRKSTSFLQETIPSQLDPAITAVSVEFQCLLLLYSSSVRPADTLPEGHPSLRCTLRTIRVHHSFLPTTTHHKDPLLNATSPECSWTHVALTLFICFQTVERLRSLCSLVICAAQTGITGCHY